MNLTLRNTSAKMEWCEFIGEDLAAVRVILADVKDASSLQNMASQAHVVANCVGPYRLYGEAVVSACIASGTHHVDVNGEPQVSRLFRH
jgi:short subunit dehydrogenase-like uncharacterized protein